MLKSFNVARRLGGTHGRRRRTQVFHATGLAPYVSAIPFGPFLLEEMMTEASTTLSKAQTFATMGMGKTAEPLWACAAALQERTAPLLDVEGEAREAAVYRMSAASCYEKAGDRSRAANLYQAALAGPLRPVGGRRDAGRLPGAPEGGINSPEVATGCLGVVRQ